MQMNGLEGQVAIVTGGAGVLGHDVAASFARAGAQVVLSDADRERGAAAAEALSNAGQVQFIQANPAKPADVVRLVTEVMAQRGRIDVLVHHGRSHHRRLGTDLTPAQWRADLESGLSSAFYIDQAVGRCMFAGGGSIVNVAAVDLDEAYPSRATAAATANGIVGLSRALAVEWAPHRVRVNVVVPGIILDDADRAAIERGERSLGRVLLRAPGNRMVATGQIAGAVMFLSGPGAAFITGQVLYADGGWNAWTQHPEGMKFP
jgi:NAD(P)-dependent dehydrogenase (short-subunit alcohol dehydrogenase family)